MGMPGATGRNLLLPEGGRMRAFFVMGFVVIRHSLKTPFIRHGATTHESYSIGRLLPLALPAIGAGARFRLLARQESESLAEHEIGRAACRERRDDENRAHRDTGIGTGCKHPITPQDRSSCNACDPNSTPTPIATRRAGHNAKMCIAEMRKCQDKTENKLNDDEGRADAGGRNEKRRRKRACHAKGT